MGKYKWSEKEIEWLIENYPKMDRHYCSETLKIPLEQVVYKINKLKLKKEKSLDYSFFEVIDKPYVAYILGFIWADGYLTKDGRHFNVSGVEEDIDEIESLFDKLGNWCKHTDNREKYGWKNAKTLIGSNKEIYGFLLEHDYDKKSYVSADKILSKIPDDLKHYFFRGLVDGDGCFYYNKKGYLRQFALTSTYEQDWSYFENLCDELGVKFKIKRIKKFNKKTKKENKSSVVMILGKEILKLGNYVYQGEQLGLNRKQNKFNEIKKSYECNKSN
jgi:hypothetical protein